jgi:hypothetical protein
LEEEEMEVVLLDNGYYHGVSYTLEVVEVVAQVVGNNAQQLSIEEQVAQV